MFSTSPQAAADEELVVSMAKRVVKRLKDPSTWIVHVDGWSGIGRERVLDHVAAALHQKKAVVSFCGCVRVSFKTYKPDAQEYEIRRKIEEALQMSLVGYVNWEEICIALNWRPLVVILDDLQNHLDYKTLGIPPLVTDTLGADRPFYKVVYTTTDYKTRYYSTIVYKERMISGAHAHANVGDEFGELPGDVALRMILYEAHSATISTIKDYLPYVIRRDFAFGQEEMTRMMLPMLTRLHGNLFGMLTAESVIQCLFSAILFTGTGFPPYYLRSEILSRPCFGNKECFGNNENSWEAELFLRALSLDIQNRRLMFLDPEDGKLKTPDVLAASASSSSSSSIMTQLIQGYLVRRSRRLERVDMEEWSQDLTRISFADNWIKEILLPPPSAAPSNFPNLSTLILRENPQLEEIPDDVFRYMPNLRILDLSYCGISTLPSTLSFLLNLRMLYLQGCRNLQTFETTGLNHLEVLNLDYSPLPTLHKASWCHMRSLKRFSFKYGLTSLGEVQLSLENVKVFDNFDADLYSSTPTADTLQKCNISILYPKEEEEEEEEEIPRRRTRGAHLLTGDRFPYYKDIHAQVDQYPIVAAAAAAGVEKCLEINGGEGLWSLYTLSLMFRPQLLSLHNYQHAEAGIWPIPELKTCYIKYCRDMGCAFNSPRNRLDRWNLDYLETLWISSLTKLSAICNYMFEQNESFLLLKSIYLEYCPNLLVLFPVTIRLPSLEVMEIKFCASLRKLFTQQHTAGEIVLPRLKRLRLCGLPKLTSVCEEGRLPMLQKLEVRGCWSLKNVPIFPSSDSGPDVAGEVVLVVRGEEGWWKNVQGAFKKKEHHIDFKVGFASAAPKYIPQRWKRGPRRHRRHFPLSL